MKLTVERVRRVFERYLKQRGLKDGSIQGLNDSAGKFFSYVKEQKEEPDFRDITEEFIKGYLRFIVARVSHKTGRRYAPKTQRSLFGAVRAVFQCLYVNELILTNPARRIVFRPKGAGKPKEIMSIEEIGSFLDSISPSQFLGKRDRAMFELIYSSGLRAGEVSRLDVSDIDFENRMLQVRASKFGKDRVVPVSLVAAGFLKMYVGKRKEGPVFRGQSGRLLPAGINTRFKKLLNDQGRCREGLSTHSIRHCTATHLLSGGADLRYVQELLGHDSIETTVIYTNELFENIRRIYKSHHPRENEYYREVDDEYLKRLSALRRALSRQKPRSLRARERLKKNVEKVRERG